MTTKEWVEYLVWIPLAAAFAAFVAWVLTLGTPLAALPELFGISQGTAVGYAAVAGAAVIALSPLVAPLFGWDAPKPKPKRAPAAAPTTGQVEDRPDQAGRDDDVELAERQRQHLWYGEHRDLTWRDRVQAEEWGMDADTYKSNRLEAE